MTIEEVNNKFKNLSEQDRKYFNTIGLSNSFLKHINNHCYKRTFDKVIESSEGVKEGYAIWRGNQIHNVLYDPEYIKKFWYIKVPEMNNRTKIPNIYYDLWSIAATDFRFKVNYDDLVLERYCIHYKLKNDYKDAKTLYELLIEMNEKGVDNFKELYAAYTDSCKKEVRKIYDLNLMFKDSLFEYYDKKNQPGTICLNEVGNDKGRYFKDLSEIHDFLILLESTVTMLNSNEEYLELTSKPDGDGKFVKLIEQPIVVDMEDEVFKIKPDFLSLYYTDNKIVITLLDYKTYVGNILEKIIDNRYIDQLSLYLEVILKSYRSLLKGRTVEIRTAIVGIHDSGYSEVINIHQYSCMACMNDYTLQECMLKDGMFNPYKPVEKEYNAIDNPFIVAYLNIDYRYGLKTLIEIYKKHLKDKYYYELDGRIFN